LIASGISRKQSEVPDGSVRADVKIRQRSLSWASATTICQEALSSEETCFPRKRFSLIYDARQSGVQSFDSGITDRHFGIDDGIPDGRTPQG
jgi:hypothetical protein